MEEFYDTMEKSKGAGLLSLTWAVQLYLFEKLLRISTIAVMLLFFKMG